MSFVSPLLASWHQTQWRKWVSRWAINIDFLQKASSFKSWENEWCISAEFKGTLLLVFGRVCYVQSMPLRAFQQQRVDDLSSFTASWITIRHLTEQSIWLQIWWEIAAFSRPPDLRVKVMFQGPLFSHKCTREIGYDDTAEMKNCSYTSQQSKSSRTPMGHPRKYGHLGKKPMSFLSFPVFAPPRAQKLKSQQLSTSRDFFSKGKCIATAIICILAQDNVR